MNPHVVWLYVLLAFTPHYSQATSATHTVLVLGDSISAAYGIAQSSGWVELLKQRLQQRGNYRVINASLSGETTSGGLQRLPQLLQDHRPQLLIVELGGNDGLRGQPIKLIQDNLQSIVQLGKQHGSEVYLLGMRIPPNYGNKYTSQFRAVYQKIAKQENVAFLPFFLQHVATNKTLMQADGLHPNDKAQQRLLDNMLSRLPPAVLGKTADEPH